MDINMGVDLRMSVSMGVTGSNSGIVRGMALVFYFYHYYYYFFNFFLVACFSSGFIWVIW